MSQHIRPATPADAGVLARVKVASWRVAFRGLMPESHLAGLDVAAIQATWDRVLGETDWPRSGMLVLERDDEIAGYSHFYPTDDADDDPSSVGMIGSLYTLPEVWGTGAGKALMTRVVETLTEAGYAEASLWVLVGNRRARAFYEGQGWKEDGGRDEDRSDGFLVSKLRYRRSLG
ncbi:GNAT family N-acetyltransferase [Actinomadura kijaniata]|uniref:GNAT family N-acetyltransferase n=1 Tax=Actinomadura kijaniata TaxID=46161 RepID=UPI00082B25FF|nr:GNAT family N-acetyltransferase [Actinomadura kijaniata]